MTYHEYKTYLLTCEYLGKEPTGKYKMVYDYLMELWDSMDFMVDIHFNMIILLKEGNKIMEMDSLNGYLWCHTLRVWSFFREDMGMELTETRAFMKSTVEEYLMGEVGNPQSIIWYETVIVEEHLQCTVGTPEKQTCQV